MTSTTDLARQIRAEAVKMVAHAKASHIGGALSMADLLAVLFMAGTVRRQQTFRWHGTH